MDTHWTEAARKAREIAPDGHVFAPPEMLAALPGSVDYRFPASDAQPSVVVLHKGRVSEVDRACLIAAMVTLQPVFANAVFVVFGKVKTADAALRAHLPALVAPLAAAFDKAPNAREAHTRPAAIYLGNNTLLGTLADGQKIYLDGTDISLTPHLALDGYWEQWITDLFLDHVKPGMHVVDIGANCGYFTLLACKAVGESGRVTAIDANPRMAELVSNSVSVNGYFDRCRVENCAVMEQDGTITFAVPKRYKGSATYMRDGVDFTPYADSHDLMEVPGKPLSAVVEGPVDLMKIDAEGAEPIIFRGAIDFFRQSGAMKVFMEFAPGFFSDIISGADFLDQIESVGFRVSIITHDGRIETVGRDRILSLPHCDLFLDKT